MYSITLSVSQWLVALPPGEGRRRSLTDPIRLTTSEFRGHYRQWRVGPEDPYRCL